jgi:hypothetical protein
MPNRPNFLILSAAALLLAIAASLWLKRPKPPTSPPPLVVRTCANPPPAGRIISEGRTSAKPPLQFSVSQVRLHVSEGAADAPPFSYGADITIANTDSRLRIVFLGHLDSKAEQVFSKYFETRKVLNAAGKTIGEDKWGYTEERFVWRAVRFAGHDFAAYHLTDAKDAQLFDQIISTACFASTPDNSPAATTDPSPH